MSKIKTMKGPGGSITIHDYTDVVLVTMQGALGAAAENVKEVAREEVEHKMLYGYHDVHGDPPHTEIVDTGKLFDSLQANVQRDSQSSYRVTVGTKTAYAYWVHEGTYKLKGRKFITDAMNAGRKKIESAIVRGVRNNLKG